MTIGSAPQLLTVSHWPADESSDVIDTTVGGVLRDTAAKTPDATALVAHRPDGTRSSWTYRELLADAERAAAGLLTRFAPGERLAVWAPNTPEWVILEFGAGLAGIVLVTVNPAYRPSELAYVLNQSGASGIFLTESFRSPMLQYLQEIRSQVPTLREVVLFSDWDAFLEAAPAGVDLPNVQPSDVAQIQYTSGTTGFPKGAALHHRGIVNNGRFFAERAGVRAGDVYLSPMPLFHTAGCVMGVLGMAGTGATLVPIYAFDPNAVLDICEAERATGMGGVPTMLIALMAAQRANPRDLSSLKVVVSGGSLVPADLVRQVERELAVTFSIVFGTTECSPLLTQVALDDDERTRAETVGRALPQTEVRVCDPATGDTVPVGQLGELCARGYLVMRGYHDNPAATASAIDADGWYHTGDVAAMDEQGYVRIEGRIKDMIIRGGENIYPREIEDLLFAHPAVADVAVVGLPDDLWGEIVAAVIRRSPDVEVTSEELHNYCRQHLAAYKTPVRWEYVDGFPLTGSGKIQKFKLRDQLISMGR
ncbi:AMP-binding protein [Smaragdicoccus niigatensis]|uniref:AMP-binding protein n=1 Tax=Smaragdicoccus niigatensis TaxID=359359 RepID=UPI000379FBD4|nr:AMP-binding protein [Smaragdicoccus niigatensis]